jgi:hypothetical protein
VDVTGQPYIYAGGDPVNRTDPTGEFWWILAGAVVGATANVMALYISSGGNVSGQQLAAAMAEAGIFGAIGEYIGAFPRYNISGTNTLRDAMRRNLVSAMRAGHDVVNPLFWPNVFPSALQGYWDVTNANPDRGGPGHAYGP